MVYYAEFLAVNFVNKFCSTCLLHGPVMDYIQGVAPNVPDTSEHWPGYSTFWRWMKEYVTMSVSWKEKQIKKKNKLQIIK